MNVNWSPISAEQSAALEHSFTEEEVYIVVSSLGSSKSPGPYSFAAEFYKFFCSTLKLNIMNMISDFYSNGIINATLNETFLCLIPKKVDARNNYRPISLISCAYKIIARVLSDCLKRVLPDTIVPNQLAFVEN